MSKILALDFGLKRTGLAISDENAMFAFPLETIPSEELLKKLEQLLSTESIFTIVLGFPRRLDSSESHITENVIELKSVLERKFPMITIELIDERFTSKMASDSIHFAGASKKQKKDKSLIDKVSATIILQSYLQSRQV